LSPVISNPSSSATGRSWTSSIATPSHRLNRYSDWLLDVPVRLDTAVRPNRPGIRWKSMDFQVFILVIFLISKRKMDGNGRRKTSLDVLRHNSQ
jgi:hypothetical protein